MGAADVDVEVAVPLRIFVPFSAVDVVDALPPTSSVLVADVVELLEAVSVAFDVIVVVSEKSVPYVVESDRLLSDL